MMSCSMMMMSKWIYNSSLNAIENPENFDELSTVNRKITNSESSSTDSLKKSATPFPKVQASSRVKIRASAKL